MKLLIIDSHSIMHRVKFGFWNRKFRNQYTGVVFGFWMNVLKIVKIINPDKVVFIFDSHREKLLRRQIYPQYKDRVVLDKRNEMINQIAIPQFDIIKDDFLPSIGFSNLFNFEGYEADDIIASITLDDNYSRYEKIIVSTDHDLYQLLRHNCHFFNVITNQIYTTIDFYREYFIKPKYWSTVKALAGCTSDNVKGIDGVGEKTAIKWILNQIKPKSKIFKKINELQDEILKINIPIVKLPYKNCPQVQLQNDKLTIHKYNQVVNSYGFSTFHNNNMLAKFKILL